MKLVPGRLRAAVGRAGARLPTSPLRVLAARLAGARLGRGCRLEAGSYLAPGCSLGPGCRVGRQAVLAGEVHLGPGCTVGDFARLARLTAGEGTHIETQVLCLGARPGRIRIGRHCYIGAGALLDHSAEITLGDHVHVAGPTAALHTHSSVPMALAGSALHEDGRLYGDVQVGGNTWIGGHVTIYPGARVGDHCVVLPNSVVTGAVESRSMVGGVPARVVRRLSIVEDGSAAGPAPATRRPA